jgi:dienelactone hydrolase
MPTLATGDNEMPGQEIRYEADGLTMIGSLHRPAKAGAAPGVLVFPEAFGLGSHAIGKAERLASELGYVALACDLWGERKQLGGMDELMSALGALAGNIPSLRARVTGALKTLTSQQGVDGGRIAAMGFCFGGTMSFELATCSDIKAAIGFHSGLQVPSLASDAKKIKAKVLAMLGADDPGIPPEARAEFTRILTDAGVDWTMTLFGGVVHSYTNPDADKLGQPDFARYDARADKRSWKEMAAALEEAFA